MSVPQSTNAKTTIVESPNGDSCDDIYRNHLGQEFPLKKGFCQDLEKRGLLDLLSSSEPKQIGFTLDWYRHSMRLGV